MGTNYYLHTDFCPCCGHPKQKIHLGKNSCGWKFLFHKTSNIKDFPSFCGVIMNGLIYDEYDRLISTDEMLEIIESSMKEKDHPDVEIIKGYNFLAAEFY